MINKVYQPADFENKWYQHWESSGYFQSKKTPDSAKPYSILLPPPNVTGTLHMGHAFQHTLMDTLIRYHRMRGFDVLWQAGTDHAGIATQLVVERQLEAEGLTRAQLGREKFLERVWQWRAQSGNTITRQMRRLGSSCDWSREKFTMDDELSATVTAIFVRLYREGLIYRGKRLVSWDPKIKTAVSDLEVENQERAGQMWHILYPFSEGAQLDHLGKPMRGMTIATTRPETMLADGALAVHPEDERYRHLVGKKVDLPLCNRSIPIIADDFVDRAFGSGCVKITGAHDANDYACAKRHNIPLYTIMDFSAKMIAPSPAKYIGMDRYQCREAVVADLQANDYLVKTVPHIHQVPVCTRTGEVIEPMLTDQWFVTMEGLAKEGLAAVSSQQVQFIPENWLNSYRQWLENIQDWCISRQLWWGHRIPAWFDDEGKVYVAHNIAEAQALAGNRPLTQDEDVLDTWFSSALWPFSTLGWRAEGTHADDLSRRYLPTSVLITGFDIIFFWVARMVMMTEHLLGVAPFSQVHITGLVRDAEGHKMSKSKGNIIDPIDLMDGIDLPSLLEKRTFGLMQPQKRQAIIEDTRKHFPQGIAPVGADALRFTFLALASHGRDIKFDPHRCEGYRNFCTKLWNATRFVLLQGEGEDLLANPSLLADHPPSFVEAWMISRLQRAEAECAEHFAHYRFDWLAKTIFELVWNDFCDWFVEAVKVLLSDPTQPERVRATKLRLARILETILRLAHPLIPFITEELWQPLARLIGKNHRDHPTIMLEPYPICQPSHINPTAEAQFSALQSLVEQCRQLRSEMKIPPQQRLPLIIARAPDLLPTLAPFAMSLAKLSECRALDTLPESPAPSAPWMGGTLMLKIEVDAATERARLLKEQEKIQKEIEKINAQLGNPSFVDKAPPAVLAQAKSRLVDYNQKLTTINANLARFA